MRNQSRGYLDNSRRIYFRYIVVGLANTLVTISMFVLLSSKLNYVSSYLASYAVGIVINLYYQPKSVFQVKSNASRLKRLLVANLLIIGVGVTINYLLDIASVKPFFAAILTAVVTIPIGFLLTKNSLLGKLESNN